MKDSGASFSLPKRDRIDQYSLAELVSLACRLQTEHLYAKTELMERMVAELGFKRMGKRIERRLAEVILLAKGRG